MESKHQHRGKASAFLDAGFFVVLVIVTLILQTSGEAYAGSFGSQPDEPAHYVTSLMIRDYLAAGAPADPLSFAKDFYVHYPRVAFGLCPPLFHATSGVWMFLFGPDRSSIMAFMALITASWAFLLYRVMASGFGLLSGMVAALLLVLLPATQVMTSSVMLDIPCAALMLLAVSAYARYIKTESPRDAMLFGLWASGALLVKYNALALALVPPFAIVLAGKYYLLRRATFWLPAGIVAGTAGVWYFAMRDWVMYAAEDVDRWTAIWQPAWRNVVGLVDLGGPVLFVLCAAGVVWVVAGWRKGGDTAAGAGMLPEATAGTALVAGLWAFHSFIFPIFEERYLLPAAPAMLLLAYVPLHSVRKSAKSGAVFTFGALGVIVASFFTFAETIPKKGTISYVQVAEIVRQHLPDRGVVLISADSSGEGMLISELAMKDRNLNLTVARASKLLADQNLMGQQYRLRYATSEALMEIVDRVPISVAVVEECEVAICGEHVALLDKTIETVRARWHLIRETRRENGKMVRIYRVAGNEKSGLKDLAVDMRRTLGVVLESRNGAEPGIESDTGLREAK